MFSLKLFMIILFTSDNSSNKERDYIHLIGANSLYALI